MLREPGALPRLAPLDKIVEEGELRELAAGSSAPRTLAAQLGFAAAAGETAHAAAILALFGWRLRRSNALSGGSPSAANPFRSPDPTPPEGADPSASAVLQCGLCGRTCGLWNFAGLVRRPRRAAKARRTSAPTARPTTTASPQKVEMISCYKRGRHPAIGGLEPRLGGQYRAAAPAAPAAAAAPSATPGAKPTAALGGGAGVWSGHFAAEARLWASPPAESRKRRREPDDSDEEEEDDYDAFEQDGEGRYRHYDPRAVCITMQLVGGSLGGSG